jgi:hypothetical protein
MENLGFKIAKTNGGDALLACIGNEICKAREGDFCLPGRS